MTVFLCIDDNRGMLFNNRRQSRDSEVINDMLKTASSSVYAHSFSEKYLSTLSSSFTFSDTLLEEKKDFCFIENLDIAPYLSSIDSVILYKWNRDYPFDVTFDVDLKAEGYRLENKTDFAGSSHDKITKEVWVK